MKKYQLAINNIRSISVIFVDNGFILGNGENNDLIVIILIGLAVFAILFLSDRILGVRKHDHVTREEKGASDVLDLDMAVVESGTGPDTSKKIDYFI